MADDIYSKVIREYSKTGSVKQSAENAGTSLVRAQRILITEGLWSSPTSDKVCELYRQGKTVKEIAEILYVSEKTVQAYLPYTRSEKGYGGAERSADAIKSKDYRKRMHHANESQVSADSFAEELKEMEKKKEALRKISLNVLSDEELSKAWEEYDRKVVKEGRNAELGKMTVEDLYYDHMKKAPEVFRLELSLDLEYVRDKDFEVLRKYGKVEKGITREVLVPSDITLHALNYVILRAFGWQNSHLHHFRLPDAVFQEIIGGKNKPKRRGYVKNDGLYKDWMKLCGIYFRFPSDDFEDLYWDDDYEEGESIRTWFRRKYTGPYHYYGDCEHYIVANGDAREFYEDNPVIREPVTFDEWEKRQKEGGKKPIDRIKPIDQATIFDVGYGMQGRMDELIERIPLVELMMPEGVKKVKNLKKRLKELAADQEKTVYDLPVIPLTSELIYAYDYGDGWEVKIRLKDCYYTMSRYDIAGEMRKGSMVTAIMDSKRAIADDSAYDMNNQPAGKALALKVATVFHKSRPQCIALDGMNLMDDVGGIHGYINFLRTIHGDDPDEKEEMKEWARYMGWTGRMNKPETVL